MLAILETAIGLVFVFTLVSLACSVAVEWISAIFAVRGKNLWRGIDSMLGKELSAQVCAHGLLQGLVRKTWFDVASLGLKRPKPSYVPAKIFATATLSVLSEPTGIPKEAEELRAMINKAQVGKTGTKAKEALLALVDAGEGTLEATRKNIEDWFDATMERATGWYKRWTQLTLFVVGFFVALIVGVDAIAITASLWQNPDLREAVADAAQAYVEEHTEDEAATGEPSAESGQLDSADLSIPLKALQSLSSELQANRLPLHPLADLRADSDRTWEVTVLHLIGFLLTAMAASLGAPFWFDLVGKLVKLRAAGPPPVSTPGTETPEKK